MVRLGVRIVRRDVARPGMELLTRCSVSRTRLEMRTVRMDMTEPGMESLTSCDST